jgi:hypothetical protein
VKAVLLVDVFQVDQPALNVTKQQDSANARKLLLAPSVTLALMVSSALQQVVKNATATTIHLCAATRLVNATTVKTTQKVLTAKSALRDSMAALLLVLQMTADDAPALSHLLMALVIHVS